MDTKAFKNEVKAPLHQITVCEADLERNRRKIESLAGLLMP